ncbi:MAG: hypothetical protein IPP57_23035 [Candidatus Obscuribacter sp.]|jgi:hypothetical protein|nr:hypothetical protein [Candidatus Obscuribacter sp.]MDQ5964026.1 hypothetical protein [Cyanobacteriota bacterium erpe_2018_sw_39hr_WHONDRS-SW48-000098_B_bin.30]MBK7838736.1 hypothetical protein [Candidatus Obscuribacter sp.]MBK9202631.1 hypothetical protein [Candidatus Obscuribacter sp.]MBK9621266.1 hypothetical protein [Candidatus Obscuribacter sp.]
MSGFEKGDAAVKKPDEVVQKNDSPPQFEGTDSRQAAQANLRNDLLDKGIMPALNAKDVPATAAQAAEAMANRDLGFPSDGNKSSGTAVSRLLQASGLDIRVTPAIPDLKHQLEEKGFKASELQPGEKPKPGDVIFTSMDPVGRNVGIVGDDGKIYSHNFGRKEFVGQEKWTSKFTTVMRPGDS